MRVVAAREPRKVELFGIKIHLKPVLFGCSPSWFYFTSWFRLYQLRCYTSIRTQKHRPPKVAPGCGVFQNLNCTKWHQSDTWAQAQLEQLAVHGKVPDEAILVGNLGRPRLPRFSDATSNSAFCFGCCKKKHLWIMVTSPGHQQIFMTLWSR